ncbi:DUF3108 domain-containing protein [Acetobacter estunensis]|uniref:DUF3108 domain-containing protein n=1 Tax=Acetobacter estunensis TaxID=104097 RepID=UPI001C2CF175|nr:DUF3108 domain-containing protein [Acetobacter estunensis]MBV1837697.1 DUF3108 domain-containing protein [Acetobacter estunensis]
MKQTRSQSRSGFRFPRQGKKLLGITFLLAALGGRTLPAQAGNEETGSTAGSSHLSYTVYSHWLSVLSVETNFRLTDNRYETTMEARADGLVSLFMRMNIHANARGSIEQGQVKPQFYESTGWSRGMMRHVIIHYPGGNPKIEQLEPAEDDREPVSDTMQQGAADILATMAKLFVSVRSTGRCDATYDIFDGIRLTRMELHTGAVEVPPGVDKEWRVPALRCDFMGHQVAGFVKGHRSTSLRTPHGGSVWFENVEGRGLVPVRVSMEHPKIGRMTVELEKVRAVQ